MVELNGKEDPFRKTLIIIDEIHKIYSSSLSLLERPNPEVLQTMVQNSYKVSGVNSLKLLLMTATPITDDHMSCVKILNLLLENYERFPEEFERFKTMFCNENGLFTEKGSQEFMNRITGLVSYIDRANDRSQFAYPVIRDVMLEIEKKRVSNSDINDIALKIKEFEERLNNKEVKLTKDETKDLKKDIANLKKEQKNAVKDKDTPKDVIDFINSCFTKKTERPPATRKTAKKSKAVDAADADDAGADTGKNEADDEDDDENAVAEGTKVAIKVADPKTKTKATKATAKATKATTIPKSKKSPVAKPVKPVKECLDGKILNPTTNRCVKMKVVARDDKYSF
jgi:hypothetical protein